jgi:hypothetical protein
VKLTPQDKLALALTSFGSQRKLAEFIGVTHQKLGRWLREGQIDGAKAIPREATAAIDLAFTVHRDIAKDTARRQGLPFDPKVPVYLERKPRRDGQLGDRVFAEHTHFIRSGLRQEVIWSAQQSRKFLSVSVRSTVDIHRYARRLAVAEKSRYRRRESVETLTKYIQAGFEKGLLTQARTMAERQLGRGASESQVRRLQDDIYADLFQQRARQIDDRVTPQPIYTKYSNISPMMGNRVDSIDEVESRLRQKHEPATTAAIGDKARDIPGTRLADTLLFQLLPAKNATPTPRAKPAKSAKPRRR